MSNLGRGGRPLALEMVGSPERDGRRVNWHKLPNKATLYNGV